MRISKPSAALLVAATASATPVQPRQAAPTNYLLTFGDSYSQTGFNVTTGPLPTCGSYASEVGNPNFPGYTTSGGANWVGEIVQSAPGCLLNFNFAYGGATVNASLVAPYEPTVLSLIDQVREFSNSVASKPAPYKWTASNTAAAVWLGVNDVGNSWYFANYTTIITDEINDYFAQLQILYNAGVRKFVLLNTPPTFRSPLFIASGASTVSGVKAAIPQWNALLTKTAKAWTKAYPAATVQFVDTYSIFQNALNHPHKYGAANATCFDADGTTCLWWNNYHPGMAIQKAVGVAAYGTLFGKGSVGLIEE